MIDFQGNEESEIDKTILKHIKNDNQEKDLDLTTSMAFNFVVFNTQGEILTASNGFLSLVGLTHEEVEGKNLNSIFYNPMDTKKFSNHSKEDEFSSGGIELKHKNGNKIYTIFYNNYNSEMHVNLMFFIAA